MFKNLVFTTFLFIVFVGYSQKEPIKFGKVDVADLEMKQYALDTSAVAVVLCDYGYFNSTTFHFTEILRIKILKKEGLSWSSQKFMGTEDLEVRGKTYNLENGKVVSTPLKGESLFRKRDGAGQITISFAMPNVTVGSIIDIEFSMGGLPYKWYFQRAIPVRWSELRLESSPYIGIQKNYYGFLNLTVNEEDRWAIKDAPAFKTEPYTNSISNYISKFEISLLFINGATYKSFATSWESISILLEKDNCFGMPLMGNMFLNPIAKEIKEKSTDKLTQIKLAHQAVKHIKWNNEADVITTQQDLKIPYDKQVGNNADINLTLVALLKKLDIIAYPVVMSTRENGLLPFYPTINKLNYTLC
ncbi:MAG: hypothetical protein WCX31_21880 [Salinivirgaceae bacterium]|jgi:hypothetical protein